MAPPVEYRIDRVALPGREGVHHLTLRDGSVASIAVSGQTGEASWLALPGLINLHAHADRAYAATSFRPRSFSDALAAAARARADFTVSDVRRRARHFFERSISHGVTRIRTHTDVDPVVELRSMEGVFAARADVTGRLDVDIIAFSTSRNDLADMDSVLRLKRAVELEPDFLGASLNASSDAPRALAALLDLAEQTGLPVDLHVDEHLEPGRMLANDVADAVMARGLQGRVTLSHLCALSTLDASAGHGLIERIARAGITVIALPETNLFLQDRANGTPLRRGITLVHELLAAGVQVRFGTDNVRDWFFPFGDGDMLDTAMFAAVAGQIDDPSALLAGICDGTTSIREGKSGGPCPGARDLVRRRAGTTTGGPDGVQGRTARLRAGAGLTISFPTGCRTP